MKKKLKDLLARLDELRSQANAIVSASETRGETKLSEADEKKLGELAKEREDCKRQIALLEEQIKDQEEAEKRNASAGGATNGGASDGDDKRGGKDSEDKPGMRGGAAVVEVKTEKDVFRSYGEQLQCIARVERVKKHGGGVIGDEHRSDFNRISEVHKRATGAAYIANESDGGYLLETKVDKTIQKTVFAESPILAPMKQIPLAPGEKRFKTFIVDDLSRADGVRLGGVSGEWVKEGESTTQTKVKLKAWEAESFKFMCQGRASEEMLRHAPQLEAIMLDAYRQETRFQFAEAGFHGGGSDRPLGILDSANPAKLEVAIEGGQTAKILFENVLKMHNRMIPNLATGYKWYINPEMLDYLPFMKITIGDAGQAVFLPSNITGTLYGTLLGKELVPCEQCSAPGTVGDIVLANFSQYGALAEGGERSDMSTHVYFLTDETAFRFINYMGGKPLRNGPITPKRGSNGFKFADFITLGAR